MNISLICPTHFLTLPAARRFPGNRIFRKKYQKQAAAMPQLPVFM